MRLSLTAVTTIDCRTTAMYGHNIMFCFTLSACRRQGEKAGEHLRFLTFRLDFNDYHSLQYSAAAAAGRAPGGVGVSPLTHPTHHHNQQQSHLQQSGGRHSSNTATAQSTAFPFHDRESSSGDDGSHISSLPSYRRRESRGRGGVPIQLDQDYSPSK